MIPSKDINFVGYTYKNFEIVQDSQLPGVAELRKKGKPKRPSIKSLFDPSSTNTTGSFMSLATQFETPESPDGFFTEKDSSSHGRSYQPSHIHPYGNNAR
ncbi:hypothetical protein O6H91_Y062700 [Diphasiastrum complanatum]|nr:hypothetical protein O6H91_Y062700 [Diphasiastrum complanatum]